MARTIHVPYAARRVWDPVMYQGGGTSRRYFEGWYFKCVDAAEEHPVAVVPGVSFSVDGSKAQAFVQLIRHGCHPRVFEYPAADFSFSRRPPFRIRIGGNAFTEHGMTLDLADEQGGVRGDIEFGPWFRWPVSPFAPGTTGWYRFVPRMECYHGVLSLDHFLVGSLTVDGEVLDFHDGRGYVEKDWGRGFPTSWVWVQSNSFGYRGVSLTCSVARIPWVTGAFVGHHAGVLHHGQLYRLGSHTGSKIVRLETRPGGADITLRDERTQLELGFGGGTSDQFQAPALGAMEGRVGTSLGGAVTIRLQELRGWRPATVFEGTGRCAGLEVVDENRELTADGKGES